MIKSFDTQIKLTTQNKNTLSKTLKLVQTFVKVKYIKL